MKALVSLVFGLLVSLSAHANPQCEISFTRDLVEIASKGKAALSRDVTRAESAALWDAHVVGYGEPGKNGGPAGVYNYTGKQLDRKFRILVKAGFSPAEARTLIEKKVVGTMTKFDFIIHEREQAYAKALFQAKADGDLDVIYRSIVDLKGIDDKPLVDFRNVLIDAYSQRFLDPSTGRLINYSESSSAQRLRNKFNEWLVANNFDPLPWK